MIEGSITGTMTFDSVDIHLYRDGHVRLQGYYMDSETTITAPAEALELRFSERVLQPGKTLVIDAESEGVDCIWVTADNDANLLRVATDKPERM